MAKRLLSLLLLCSLLPGCARNLPEEAAVSTAAAQTSVPTTVATVPETTVPETTEPQPERFLLTFVGDCTFGGSASSFNAGQGFAKTMGEDYAYPFRMVAGCFQEDEASFLNLEGPLCDTLDPAYKKHVFHGPVAYGNILTVNSIEAVSLANNHTLDHGTQGYDSTLEVLQQLGVHSARPLESTLFTTESGLTIGLYGATYEDMDPETVVQGIRELAAQEPDILIFAPHWGYEGSYRPNQKQISLGRAAIDAGADIVWGSHPHVLQPVESYNGGMIFYSLGNFSFGGNGGPRDYDTAIIQQEVIRDGEGNVTLGQTHLIPCRLSGSPYYNDFQPYPYEEGSEGYVRAMEKLTGDWYGRYDWNN